MPSSGATATAASDMHPRRSVKRRRRQAFALAAFVTEVAKDRSTSSAAEPITVSQTLEKWLNSRKAEFSPATTDRYRVAIKHVEAVLGQMRVARLRPHHIEDRYSELVAKGQSDSSKRKIQWALRQSLAWAHRRGYCLIIATTGLNYPPRCQGDGPTLLRRRTSGDRSLAGERPQLGNARGSDRLDWLPARGGGGTPVERRRSHERESSHPSIGRRGSDGTQLKGTTTGDIERIAIEPKTLKLLKAQRMRGAPRARQPGGSDQTRRLCLLSGPGGPAALQPVHDHSDLRRSLQRDRSTAYEVARSSTPFGHNPAEERRECRRSHGSTWLADGGDGQSISRPPGRSRLCAAEALENA